MQENIEDKMKNALDTLLYKLVKYKNSDKYLDKLLKESKENLDKLNDLLAKLEEKKDNE